MNRVILMGRLTRDPEVRYSQGERSMAIARYTLAVDRRGRRSQDGDQGQTADFINIVAFDRAGEFAEKYFRQGMRVLVSGRIQTGSYVNKDGQKVYTTDIIVDDQEFADSKGQGGDNSGFGGGIRDCDNAITLLRRRKPRRLSAGDKTCSVQCHRRWIYEYSGWSRGRRTSIQLNTSLRQYSALLLIRCE